jgi:RNase adaptor protein for sRNA GlmZ degradation
VGGIPLIKVVGISASGKSTLVRGLRRAGFDARPVSQEHSQVPDMWRRLRPPDLLIFLYADLESQIRRRPDLQWTDDILARENARLAHAHRNADLVIDTRKLSVAGVLHRAIEYLDQHQIRRSHAPLPCLPNTGASADV